MPGRHLHALTVRFGDCDPAGIVYFPRFYDWFHQAMETWFDVALGQRYDQVLKTHLFPAVHSEADFKQPVRMGAHVVVETVVGRMGGASLQFDYRVLGEGGVVHATGHTVVVVVAGSAGAQPDIKASRIPDHLRERIAVFMARDDPDPLD